MSGKTVKWKGQSGRAYGYTVHELATNWNDVAGNYFARRTGAKWQAVYVGETGSLKDRLPNHEVRDCARRNGATHIHAHVNGAGERTRRAEEDDVIALHRPVCNKQTP